MTQPQGMKVYTREEATEVNRPEGLGNPWTWSEPIQAIVQDSHKFGITPLLDDRAWDASLTLYQQIIGNLYDQGFAIVREAP